VCGRQLLLRASDSEVLRRRGDLQRVVGLCSCDRRLHARDSHLLRGLLRRERCAEAGDPDRQGGDCHWVWPAAARPQSGQLLHHVA